MNKDEAIWMVNNRMHFNLLVQEVSGTLTKKTELQIRRRAKYERAMIRRTK